MRSRLLDAAGQAAHASAWFGHRSNIQRLIRSPSLATPDQRPAATHLSTSLSVRMVRSQMLYPLSYERSIRMLT
jgi:hypothetical protein